MSFLGKMKSRVEGGVSVNDSGDRLESAVAGGDVGDVETVGSISLSFAVLGDVGSAVVGGRERTLDTIGSSLCVATAGEGRASGTAPADLRADDSGTSRSSCRAATVDSKW
jgi:hypothetical protein